MNNWKLYLLSLFFMLLGGAYLMYQLNFNDISVNYISRFGIYLLVAHGVLLGGFTWIIIGRVLGGAIYKEGVQEFRIGIAMIAAYVLPIIILGAIPFESLIVSEYTTLGVATIAFPFGATLGYRVDLKLE